jgi:hypothetical protein
MVSGSAFRRLGQIGRSISFGWLLALLVLLADRMDGVTAAMFGGLALAILLSPFPVPWKGPA